jgi:hypothetical protein
MVLNRNDFTMHNPNERASREVPGKVLGAPEEVFVKTATRQNAVEARKFSSASVAFSPLELFKTNDGFPWEMFQIMRATPNSNDIGSQPPARKPPKVSIKGAGDDEVVLVERTLGRAGNFILSWACPKNTEYLPVDFLFYETLSDGGKKYLEKAKWKYIKDEAEGVFLPSSQQFGTFNQTGELAYERSVSIGEYKLNQQLDKSAVSIDRFGLQDGDRIRDISNNIELVKKGEEFIPREEFERDLRVAEKKNSEFNFFGLFVIVALNAGLLCVVAYIFIWRKSNRTEAG